jgi:hypothetical protein
MTLPNLDNLWDIGLSGIPPSVDKFGRDDASQNELVDFSWRGRGAAQWPPRF